MSAYCQACAVELAYKPGDVVGRTDECPQCRAELHACVHCVHYDPKSYNQCREPQAERVDDRVKANFCEYFRIRGTKPGAVAAPRPPGALGGLGTPPAASDRAADARAKLEGLFRKKPDS